MISCSPLKVNNGLNEKNMFCMETFEIHLAVCSLVLLHCLLPSEIRIHSCVLLCFEWGMPSSGCHFPIYFAIFFMQEMTENIFEGLSPLFSLRSISHFFVVYKPLSCISGMNFETKIDLAVSLLAKMLQELLQKLSLFLTVFVFTTPQPNRSKVFGLNCGSNPHGDLL